MDRDPHPHKYRLEIAFVILASTSIFSSEISSSSHKRFHGLVLAQTSTDWICYDVYVTDTIRDSVSSEQEMVFWLDLFDGKYQVSVWVGDLHASLESMILGCNGEYLHVEARRMKSGF